VRSTRSDARWSCLVYPNYLLSRQVRRVHQLRRARFRVTFLPFFLPMADDALHIETPPKCVSRCRLYRRRRDIRGFRRKSRYNMANVAYYYDKLLRVKIYPLHCTYFIQAFMKYTQHCVLTCRFPDITLEYLSLS